MPELLGQTEHRQPLSRVSLAAPPHTVAGVPRTGKVPCRVPVPRGAAAAICELRAQAGGWSRCGKVLWLALDARLIRSEHVLTAPRELLGAHAEESPAF